MFSVSQIASCEGLFSSGEFCIYKTSILIIYNVWWTSDSFQLHISQILCLRHDHDWFRCFFRGMISFWIDIIMKQFDRNLNWRVIEKGIFFHTIIIVSKDTPSTASKLTVTSWLTITTVKYSLTINICWDFSSSTIYKSKILHLKTNLHRKQFDLH